MVTDISDPTPRAVCVRVGRASPGRWVGGSGRVRGGRALFFAAEGPAPSGHANGPGLAGEERAQGGAGRRAAVRAAARRCLTAQVVRRCGCGGTPASVRCVGAARVGGVSESWAGRQ